MSTKPFPKSRSQLRREEDERQTIAFRFTELSAGQVDQLPLDAAILTAIHTAKETGSNTPKRRARLHVATLLRDVPLEELREMVRRIDRGEPIRAEGRSRLVDRWVELLRADEGRAIEQLLAAVPDLEVSRIRQLVRNARRETVRAQASRPEDGSELPDTGATGKAERALRDYLTQLRPETEGRIEAGPPEP